MADFNGKRRKFVEEYLKDLNATQAAIRAGYSEKTACKQGSRLLTFVDIQEAIQEAQSAQATRSQITVDEVVTELRNLAFGAAESGNVRARALELLGKHLGMFTDVVKHEGEVPALVWRMRDDSGS